MSREKSSVNKILVVSLTNIGDVILTLPVIDILRRDFPKAAISVVIGPKAGSLFNQNPHLKKVYIYDKRQSPLKTIRYAWGLRREKFDLVVDLRNSALPFLIAPRRRTPAAKIKQENLHMRDKHLNRLKTVHSFDSPSDQRYALFVPQEDQIYIHDLMRREIGTDKSVIVVAPGAAYHAKRWHVDGFAELCDRLVKNFKVAIVFVGDSKDRDVIMQITKKMDEGSINLAGKTTLIQMAELMHYASLVISNDSAPMHLASYLNKPVLALFGPSDPIKYGPWSQTARFLKGEGENHDDMINSISVDQVFDSLRFDGKQFSLQS